MTEITNEKLCAAAANGDTAALYTLWEQTERVFYMLANRLYNHWQDRATACGVTQEDCCQVCWFAFLDAVEAYNKEPERKEKFTSFIGFHVKRQIYVRT
jgi:DNA-directed RNA polymerase specialized sigma subunit